VPRLYSLCLVVLTSFGRVGQYLIESLNLPLLGVLTSPLLAPKAIILASEPMHSVRVHGDHRVVVFTSEGKIENEAVSNGIVESIIDYCKR